MSSSSKKSTWELKGKPGIWLELSDFSLIDSGIEPDYDTSQSII